VRLSPSDRQELLQNGWIEFMCDLSTDSLAIARQFGEPLPSRRGGPLVDCLMPKKQEDAHPRSISAIYGTGEFPFHTDGAYMRVPPRFMLLRFIEGKSDRTTLLLDAYALPFSAEERREMFRDVWVVNGGRGRFLTTVFNNSLVSGSTIVRHDRGCMRPAHPAFNRAADILDLRSREIKSVRINWKVGHTLVLDNWRMLHARGSSSLEGVERRVLERVLVGPRYGARS
jgi:alpha-ketoglutarate-dependent taurine dioxygenase